MSLRRFNISISRQARVQEMLPVVRISGQCAMVRESRIAEVLIQPNRLRSPKIRRQGSGWIYVGQSEKVGRGKPDISV